MCPNALSLVGGTVLGGCVTVKGCGPAGGSRSEWVDFKILQSSPTSWPIPVSSSIQVWQFHCYRCRPAASTYYTFPSKMLPVSNPWDKRKPVFILFLVRYLVTSKRKSSSRSPQRVLGACTDMKKIQKQSRDASEISAWELSTTTCQPLWETCPHTACCLGLEVGTCPSQQSQKTRPSQTADATQPMKKRAIYKASQNIGFEGDIFKLGQQIRNWLGIFLPVCYNCLFWPGLYMYFSLLRHHSLLLYSHLRFTCLFFLIRSCKYSNC